MTRSLFIDPFGGAAGDMLLGALVDAGVNQQRLGEVLDGLHLEGWRLEVTRDRQQGFAGTRVSVRVAEPAHPARHLADVERLLLNAALPDRVRSRALAAFLRLFEAEAEVHGVPVADAHLHELAAVDAVIDIVGVCAAIELLDVERVECAPVPVGSGTVQTAHGLLPVPPPAVARLLRGIPLAGHAAGGEMTTPTGATLLATLVERFGPPPAGKLAGTGVGLGTRTFPGVPNFLRVLLVERDAQQLGRPMVVLETTMDDVTGETLGTLLERLREAGAVDAWCVPGTGRKGRPMVELRVLIEPEGVPGVCAALFAEGATLGVRLVECTRPELARHTIEVATPYGGVRVKIGVFEGRVVSAKPEHDDVRSTARRAAVSESAVADAARVSAPRVGSPWEV
jgi:uncharacterized protein (TIGR00299 family) protein